MKNYKNYNRFHIGESDAANLTVKGISPINNDIQLTSLNFGEDGYYKAYLVDLNAEIPAHYTKVAEFKHYLKIYDDFTLSFEIKSDNIAVYRAGEFGCIIQANDLSRINDELRAYRTTL